MTVNDYAERHAAFVTSLPSRSDSWRREFIFESLSDECLFGDIADTRRWYRRMVQENQMTSELIPLADCRQWTVDPTTGSFVHESGEFFRVDGLRVRSSPTREVLSGWDQPILTQVGYDGGILGLLRKRFSGVPHYLVEAKAEPGNYNIVQITTTIQATFSNLKRAHKGGGTPYSEYFTDPRAQGANVLLEQWLSEDGGRLFNKRNKSMLVEVSEDHEVLPISDRYRWVSLYQLKRLTLVEDAIVAPHVRGILSIV
jgi:oxidase EvaA